MIALKELYLATTYCFYFINYYNLQVTLYVNAYVCITDLPYFYPAPIYKMPIKFSSNDLRHTFSTIAESAIAWDNYQAFAKSHNR